MYIWGGSSEHPARPYRFVCDNSLLYLETTTYTWVCPHVGVPPVGRKGHSTFVYNGQLYIFGGYNNLLDTYFVDMHKYDPRSHAVLK